MNQKKLIFSVLIISITVTHCDDNSGSLYFVANNKGLDYKIAGKKDAHRFGVELKENKQFHHTITAEDGVRLGCYGYELNGSKYSTNYIADGKGYRLAPNQDLISVFAKGSSEPRVASFRESFTAEEIEKANIRYFFPEGCEAPKIFIDPNNPSKAYEERRKLFDSLVQKAQAEQLKKLNERNNSNSLSNNSNRSNGSPNSSTSMNANNDNNLTKNPRGSDISHSLNSRNNNNNNNVGSNPGSDAHRKGKSATADDECCALGIQIQLPQNSISGACAGKMAKLIIPINSEKLSSVPMKELLDISAQSSTSPISSVLGSLQKLVEKYEL